MFSRHVRLNVWVSFGLFGIVERVDDDGVMHGVFNARDGSATKTSIRQFRMQAKSSDIADVVVGKNILCFPLFDSEKYTVATCDIDNANGIDRSHLLPDALNIYGLLISVDCIQEEVQAEMDGKLFEGVSCR